MNATTPIFAASALAAAIDGISNIVLGSADLSPLSFMKTPEPESEDGYKNNSSAASTIATPRSGMQNDKEYLIEEISGEMLAFPVLKNLTSNARQVRKWKLKARFSPKEIVYDEAHACMPAVRLAPRASAESTMKVPPKTPAAGIRAPNPPSIPRHKSIVQPLTPPDLKEVTFSDQTVGQPNSVLKPRPTVLFLSPRKKRRVDDNVSMSPAA